MRQVNSTAIEVHDNILSNVVSQVQIFLPFNPVQSPSFDISVSSISDDFRRSHLDIIDNSMRAEDKLFEDYLSMETMNIRAYLSFLNLTHHNITNLNVDITEMRAEVRDIFGEEVNLSTTHGYVYYRIYENKPAVLATIV